MRTHDRPSGVGHERAVHRGAVNCPACGLSIVAERTGRGEALPRLHGNLWIVGGRCPSAACAVAIYAWTESPDAAPAFLARAAALRAMRLRSALAEMALALPPAGLALALLLLAVWSAIRTAPEATGSAVLALVVAGPATIVAAACGFVALAVACHRDEHHGLDRAQASTGLRLVPRMGSYRAVRA
jgi:hypothetical protein